MKRHDPDPEPPEIPPPAHLSARAQALWRDLVPRRARSPERLVLLTVALEALARADAARAGLEGLTLTSTTERTGTIHVHPLVRVERESRQLFAKIWTILGLQFDPELDGRCW